ncbi:unnamed protein product, partial [Meganyctiphanes norvegica]
MSVAKMFRETASKYPNKTAFIFEDTKWTFSQLDEYSSRVANHLKNSGVKHGEAVALLMENRPEYVATWLGCAKLGVVCALINFNLRSSTLLHCIEASGAKILICGKELSEAVAEVQNEASDIPVLVSGLGENATSTNGMVNLDLMLQSSSNTCPDEINATGTSDILLYIFTSGTTGMPKAAITTNAKHLEQKILLRPHSGITSKWIIYSCYLRLHINTKGYLSAMLPALLFGCGVVIRKKFSASQYWIEAKKHNCTASLYIGEICRYLLNTPPKPEDKTHKVRRMVGVGLRPQLWEEFVERFNNPTILEFYGATEGNIGLVNLVGKVGAIGHLSVVFPKLLPFLLVKTDPDTGEYFRDKNGVCIPSKPGEAGEVVGIIKEIIPGIKYDGYLDKKAAQKKIIKDVRTKGDSAFASGDILVMDELGFLYFQDRTGDTFRWRGENVSTMEVEAHVSRIVGGMDIAVFGVKVPGCEGAAGMAAIADPEGTVEVASLLEGVKKVLPPYARPTFIRICKKIDLTGTFKIKKVSLKKEGFDPSVVSDPLYCLDSRQTQYLPLTDDLHQKILHSKAGF